MQVSALTSALLLFSFWLQRLEVGIGHHGQPGPRTDISHNVSTPEGTLEEISVMHLPREVYMELSALSKSQYLCMQTKSGDGSW